MPNPSPMRYPGGKHRLAGFIRLAIQKLNMPECTYVEPFAGGAGVALSLLLDGTVNRIVINDYDKAIYSFWRAVKQESTSLIDLIQNTPITMDEWYKQKKIYSTSTAYSLSLAFATLFLNRTNRSGILNAGPIGGYAQDGEWKLDVRFDKEVIIAKIDSIAKEKERIAVLSFRRLKEQYGQDYKGGILLIDELDATLYGFSQEKLVEYLWQAAGIYKIQIVFTTHSPIILKCVNKCQRKERQERGITFPPTIIKSYLRQPSVEIKTIWKGKERSD